MVLRLQCERVDVDRVVLARILANHVVTIAETPDFASGLVGLVLNRKCRLATEIIGSTIAAHIQPATRVVLLGLNLPEVVALTLVKAVLTVELETALADNVIVRERRHCLATRAVQTNRILEHPDQLLDGVVECQINASRRVCDGLVLVVLELLDEVLMALLGKTTTLLRVKLNLVNVEGRRQVVGELLDRTITRTAEGSRSLDHIDRIVKCDVEADLVVLKGDQRESQSRVAVEPELEGDIEDTRAANAVRSRR